MGIGNRNRVRKEEKIYRGGRVTMDGEGGGERKWSLWPGKERKFKNCKKIIFGLRYVECWFLIPVRKWVYLIFC